MSPISCFSPSSFIARASSIESSVFSFETQTRHDVSREHETRKGKQDFAVRARARICDTISIRGFCTGNTLAASIVLHIYPLNINWLNSVGDRSGVLFSILYLLDSVQNSHDPCVCVPTTYFQTFSVTTMPDGGHPVKTPHDSEFEGNFPFNSRDLRNHPTVRCESICNVSARSHL